MKKKKEGFLKKETHPVENGWNVTIILDSKNERYVYQELVNKTELKQWRKKFSNLTWMGLLISSFQLEGTFQCYISVEEYMKKEILVNEPKIV